MAHTCAHTWDTPAPSAPLLRMVHLLPNKQAQKHGKTPRPCLTPFMLAMAALQNSESRLAKVFRHSNKKIDGQIRANSRSHSSETSSSTKSGKNWSLSHAHPATHQAWQRMSRGPRFSRRFGSVSLAHKCDMIVCDCVKCLPISCFGYNALPSAKKRSTTLHHVQNNLRTRNMPWSACMSDVWQSVTPGIKQDKT